MFGIDPFLLAFGIFLYYLVNHGLQSRLKAARGRKPIFVREVKAICPSCEKRDVKGICGRGIGYHSTPKRLPEPASTGCELTDQIFAAARKKGINPIDIVGPAVVYEDGFE